MKIIWLGQAGLLFETGHRRIIIDPYLSNNVQSYEPNKKRRVPIEVRYLRIRPDVIICTNDRLDHMDVETLNYYMADAAGVLVLGPDSCIQRLRLHGGNNTYVRFNPGTEWTLGKLRLRAVCAETTDPHAIGVVMDAENKRYYVAGDTLYNDRVLDSLPDADYEAVFLPIGGYDDKMNAADATRMAARIRTRYAVPYGFGMFDTLNGTGFHHPGAVIPRPYKPLPFCRKAAVSPDEPDASDEPDISDEPDGETTESAEAVQASAPALQSR